MDIKSILKIIGWVLTITPLVAFIGVSIYVIKGAMEDDDLIKALVMFCVGCFALGAIILLLMFLTNFV